jgi:hypothetical protein
MFTWGSKYLFGVAVVSLLGAAVYGLASGGDFIGVISLGYKGGVGDQVGYSILVSIAIVFFLLGVINVITRDGDAVVGSELVGADHVLTVSTPRTASFWGLLGAFGVACLILGLAVSQAFFYLGVAVLFVVALEWVVLAWSDQATGDPEVNAVIRSRILGPFEVPLLAALVVGGIVVGLSRLLLAVPEIGSTVIAALVAAVIFGSAVGMAKSNAPRAIIAGVVAFGALAVLTGGVVGAVYGEREIAHHTESGAHDEGGESEAEGEGE